MSGIAGIFNISGAPVLQESLEAMIQPMAYWGPDGINSLAEGPVGFIHLLLFNTPESVYEFLPTKSRSGHLIMTATARIDNREELLHTFRISSLEAATMPDGTLILLAYEKWGELCVDYLLGNWSFAIWDRRERKLFIARDHRGATGLYYYQTPHLFAFSSCIKGLLPLVKETLLPNEMRMMQVMTSCPSSGFESAYQNIYRLPPAHCMVVTPEKAVPRRYWNLENTPSLRLKSDNAYIDAFLEVYGEAVRCRLRSLRPIGAHLSGGLDSGSVCALAAEELKKKGKSLRAFTSVPIFDVSHITSRKFIGDETSYAAATAQFVGNVDHTFIQAENVSPITGIRESLDVHDEPHPCSKNQFWGMAINKEAQHYGVGTLLTGAGGNGTVSWGGGWLPAYAIA